MTSALLLAALERVLPIIAFLLAVTLFAELADRAGVFDVAGHWIARQGRHRLWLLWLLFALFAVMCTVFLSLDTTAVLLTPVALAIANQIGASPRPFALTTLWIANTGSLLLPVSNLTNLLALHEFEGMEVDHLDYIRLALVPGVVAIAVTLVIIVALHWRDLFSRYAVDPPAAPHDHLLLQVAVVTCLLVGPAFAVGLPPWAVASAAAAVLLLATAWRARTLLTGLSLPWVMAGGFAVLTVVVSWAHDTGHLAWLTAAAGQGTGALDLVRLAGLSGATSNVANNLPAYLALEPAADGSPVRLMALLIGTNVGPLVTPWASLATLLWLQRCRARGVQWRLWRLALGGFACATAAVALSTLALTLA